MTAARDLATRDHAPLVLCADGRPGAPLRLFADPVEVIRAEQPDEVGAALDRIGAAAAHGLHVAGYLGYEAGFGLEPRLAKLWQPRQADAGAAPLVWFGLFAQVEPIAPKDLADWLPDGAGAHAAAPVPPVSGAEYGAEVSRALELIAAGEFYQANLSFRARVPVAGHPLALWASLHARSNAGWGGVVWTGEHWLLSASPELFFTLDGDRLTARPMKGTAPRHPDPAADRAAAAALAADPKQRAENLMIVDLTRNDLSRVSMPGSVTVPALWLVESFPTVHQMISVVEARLAPGLGAADVLRATFPCGSITGAPKIRAMEAIADAEGDARGPYTGSMGWIAPTGDAAFNVLIRTLTMRGGDDAASLGLGAGIVADSVPADEWAECLTKGTFVTAGQRPADLIETMRFEPEGGVVDIDRHLSRIGASAAALGLRWSAHDARNLLHGATFAARTVLAVRLRLGPTGALAVETGPAPPPPAEPVLVAVRARPVAAHDFRLRHKTGDRGFWEHARREAGTWEVVVTDADGFPTEGSFTSLFVERDGRLLTPPLARGLLPGVLRSRLLEEGRAVEAELRVEDLAGGFLIGNALRGLLRARLVDQ